MFEGTFDPKWKEYAANEWSDALVAAMKPASARRFSSPGRRFR